MTLDIRPVSTNTLLVLKAALRAGYSRVPLKRHVFSAMRRVYHPPERIYRHLHFEGPFAVNYRQRHFSVYHCGTWIENRIFWDGLGTTWEPASLFLWSQLCERSYTIIDVGANTGIYSILAAAMNPNARIIAFEPNGEFAKGISESNRINGFDVELHTEALSDTRGWVEYNGYQIVPHPAVGSTRVLATTLARFIEQEQLASIDLMKLDVEWHEPEVLRGMGDYLQRFRPNMLIEINGQNPEAGEAQAQELRSLFRSLEYRFYSIDDARGTVRPLPDLRASDFWNVLACRPEAAQALELPSGKYRHRL